MNVPSKNQVLVLLICVVFATIVWTTGCAGVAEPLPSLAITPNVLSVSAKVGTTSSQVVSVTNIGKTNVSVSQAIVNGTGFSVTGLTTPLSLIPQQSQSFTVKFAAASSGSVNGSLAIMTDAQHRPVVLSLHGSAAPTSPNVASVAVTPAAASPAPSAKVQFTAAVQGTTTNDSVTWSASMGAITPSGVYTAPATAATGMVTATSVADPTKSASAVVTVTSPSAPSPTPSGPAVTSVTVTPAMASSIAGGTLSFAANVQGTASNKVVTWKAVLGTITSSGAYTAPAKAGNDSVTAVSVADTTKSGSASVTVTTASPTPVVSSITVFPASTSATTNSGLQFTATVQGTVSDKSVSWSASLGTINSSGAYTAPAKAGTDTVTATSNADTSKSASATVAVTAPVSNPSSSASCSGSNCPAFPGAQGGGAASVGGRGGVVMEITNLNDSGPGSLRACLEATGTRTCIFRVSGRITNFTRLQVYNPFLTIAGQTAPGGGIVLASAPQASCGSQDCATLWISTHDVVVRYLTYDGSANTPTGPDTGTVGFALASGDIFNVVWDHMSARWAGNKNFVVVSNSSGNVHDTTMQWSLDYEPNVNHPVGIGTVYVSSGSGLATRNDDAHHNMFVNIDHRLPLNQSGTNVRWVNNLIYNWGFFASLQMGGVDTDYIGNEYVDGNFSTNSTHVFLAERGDGADNAGDCPGLCNNPGPPTNYFLNNVGRTGATPHSGMVAPTHVVNDAGQISMTAQGSENAEDSSPNGAMPSSWFRTTPLPAQTFPITADPVENLDAVLLSTVGNSQHLDCNGNWISNRDSQDARVIAQYQAKANGALFNGQFASPAIPTGTPCVESLHDGIPDQWKTNHGLSLTDTGVSARTAPNGYTYLENYLNGTDPTK